MRGKIQQPGNGNQKSVWCFCPVRLYKDTAVELSVEQMSVEEKLRALGLLWKNLRRDETNVPVPQWHKDLLGQRETLIRSVRLPASTESHLKIIIGFYENAFLSRFIIPLQTARPSFTRWRIAGAIRIGSGKDWVALIYFPI